MGPIWQVQLGESLVMLIGSSWAQNLGPVRKRRYVS